MLSEYVSGRTDALSPNNILVVSVGPVTGTAAPLASRVCLTFKSPLTGIFGESYMGGYLAPKLKWAGYDAILIAGRAEKPVYLYVDEKGGELRNASHLWGMTTFETEKAIKDEVSGDAAVMEIGQAGENLVKFACVCHAEGRQAGRCGAGAVMGSKRLKAITVICDRREVSVANEEALKELVAEIAALIRDDPKGTLAETYRRYGTPAMVEIANRLGFFPTRYWSEARFEGWEAISAKAMSEIVVRSRACWNCPFACGKYVEVKEGPFAGTKVEGPEYETIFAFGGLCEIGDITAIAKLNELCDAYGLDTITAGNVVAFAIEAYSRGKLDAGRNLRYSDGKAAAWLIEQIAFRKGVGDLLAEGVREAARRLGLERLAVEVKGLEPPGYDPRSLKSMALAYALSDRGACHLRAVMYAMDIAGRTDRFRITDETVAVYVDNEDRFNVFDMLVLCRFSRNVYDWERLVKLVNAITGFGYGRDDLKRISSAVQKAVKAFNADCGVEKDELPTRFYEEPIKVDGERVAVSREELEGAVSKYYAARGWK